MKRTVVVVAVLVAVLMVGGTAAATWRHWRAGQLASQACAAQPSPDAPTATTPSGADLARSAPSVRAWGEHVQAAAHQAGQAAALDGAWNDLSDDFSRYADMASWMVAAMDRYGADPTVWTADQHAQAAQELGDFRTVSAQIRGACRRTG